MKKILMATLTIGFLFGLANCGSNGGSSGSSTASTPNTAAACQGMCPAGQVQTNMGCGPSYNYNGNTCYALINNQPTAGIAGNSSYPYGTNTGYGYGTSGYPYSGYNTGYSGYNTGYNTGYYGYGYNPYSTGYYNTGYRPYYTSGAYFYMGF